MKKTKNGASQSLEAVEINKLNANSPYKIKIFSRDVKALKVKDVKRAYSKLIQDYCKGLIQNDEAKTLVYMFSGYLQLIRDVEMEERISELENRVQR